MRNDEVVFLVSVTPVRLLTTLSMVAAETILFTVPFVLAVDWMYNERASERVVELVVLPLSMLLATLYKQNEIDNRNKSKEFTGKPGQQY